MPVEYSTEKNYTREEKQPNCDHEKKGHGKPTPKIVEAVIEENVNGFKDRKQPKRETNVAQGIPLRLVHWRSLCLSGPIRWWQQLREKQSGCDTSRFDSLRRLSIRCDEAPALPGPSFIFNG
jgi:hypothetical protein